MLCLRYLQCTNIWNEDQSDILRAPAPLFCFCFHLPHSLRLSLVFSRLCPSSNTTACLRSCFPLPFSLSLSLPVSQLTGWHTYQRTKSLCEKTEENTCMHIRAQVRTWNRMQTHCMHLGMRGMQTNLTHTHTHKYTNEYTYREANLLHTHISTRFQSPPASCLPTLHLINPCVSLTKQERALSSL